MKMATVRATLLRGFAPVADMIDKGDFGHVGAGVVIFREDAINNDGSTFCLRTRRCNMNFVEQAGTLNMMHHDMLTG